MRDEDSVEIFEGRLSFIAGSNMWAVERADDWHTDNRTGARYATELITYMQETGRHTPLLGHIVRDIMRHGVFGAVEVGFFHRLAGEVTRKGFLSIAHFGWLIAI